MYPVTTPPTPTAAIVGLESVREPPTCTSLGKNDRSDASSSLRVALGSLTSRPSVVAWPYR